MSAIVAAALALGGCGGGGGSGSPAKIASKADFLAAGDAICRERDQRSVDLAKSEAANANAADLSSALADIYADTIAKLAALTLPPGSARAGAAKYVASVTAMKRPVQRMKAAALVLADARSTPKIKAAAAQLQSNVNTVTAIGDLADLNARAYGFKSCGVQGAPTPVA